MLSPTVERHRLRHRVRDHRLNLSIGAREGSTKVPILGSISLVGRRKHALDV
jgi:hypothetical protein